MRKLFLLLTLFSLTTSLHAQRLRNYAEQIVDPITGNEWRSVTLDVSTDRSQGGYNSRRNAKMEFIIFKDKSYYDLRMRFVMRAPIADWPLREKAYIILNNEAYELLLEDVHSNFYQHKTESTEKDAFGNPVTEVSFQNFQLFRKITTMTDLSRKVRDSQSIRIVVYSGRKPIIFELTTHDILKMRQIFR